MNDSIQTAKPKKRLLPKILIALLLLVIVAAGGFLLLFQGELRTLGTLERVGDTSLFTMDYIGPSPW